MLQTTTDRTEQQNFDLKVEKLPDGRFRASANNVRGVSPVVEPSREIAISRLNGLLQDAHRAGKLQR